MNVILIGYRGTGKSTVARLVAERLGWSWVDADAHLESQAGRTIREIFATEGESGFRDRESAVLRELTARDCCVIAAGGGIILREQNRQAICRSGLVVWLTADARVIADRLEADASTATRRPALTPLGGVDEVSALLAEREPLYRACAQLMIDTTTSTPALVADRIAQAVDDRVRTTQSTGLGVDVDSQRTQPE
jgi:shikimate kinase